jgi:uncharacterized membrane protein (UPF0127 family)
MIQYINRRSVSFIILAIYAIGVAFIIHSAAQDVKKIQPTPLINSFDESFPTTAGSNASEAFRDGTREPTALIGNSLVYLEVASTPAQRARGLSNRSYLPPDSGMLFLFDKTDYYSFWMKDTLIGLDFLWIDGSTVVDATRNVPAPAAGEALTHYTPRARIDKVIEVNAGWIDQHFGSASAVGEQIQFAL